MPPSTSQSECVSCVLISSFSHRVYCILPSHSMATFVGIWLCSNGDHSSWSYPASFLRSTFLFGIRFVSGNRSGSLLITTMENVEWLNSAPYPTPSSAPSLIPTVWNRTIIPSANTMRIKSFWSTESTAFCICSIRHRRQQMIERKSASPAISAVNCHRLCVCQFHPVWSLSASHSVAFRPFIIGNSLELRISENIVPRSRSERKSISFMDTGTRSIWSIPWTLIRLRDSKMARHWIQCPRSHSFDGGTLSFDSEDGIGTIEREWIHSFRVNLFRWTGPCALCNGQRMRNPNWNSRSMDAVMWWKEITCWPLEVTLGVLPQGFISMIFMYCRWVQIQRDGNGRI